MNINFEYYKVFYVIAKNKNITKAADELNISQLPYTKSTGLELTAKAGIAT